MIPLYTFAQRKQFLARLQEKEQSSHAKQARASLHKTVSNIIEEVQNNGDAALLEYTKAFDGLSMRADQLAVTAIERKEASAEVSPQFKEAIKIAKRNIENFHKLQIQRDIHYTGQYGEKLSLRARPLGKAGLYIPGGKAGKTPLFSTLLMTAIPAKLAGVKKIVVCSPPQSNLRLSPKLLYVAESLGITEIYKVGGAQAIAALAYGTKSLPAVDIIAGPGNAFVSYAKKMVFGDVMIDSLAGPSEIAIIADDSANAQRIVLDMLAQAEHQGQELAVLFTNSKKLAQKTISLITENLASYQRHDAISRSLKKRGAVMLVDNMDQAASMVNALAPEHLEILTEQDNERLLDKISHAGAIFLGDCSCESVADYLAGTNHVLPTAGTARFSSALGVSNFMRYTSIIRYTKEAFNAYGPAAAQLAQHEGLEGHARSITKRY